METVEVSLFYANTEEMIWLVDLKSFLSEHGGF
jgi:hypothetical protein